MKDASIKNSKKEGASWVNLLVVVAAVSLVGLQVVRAGVIGQIYTQIKSSIGTQTVETTHTYKGNSQTVTALKPAGIDNNKDPDTVLAMLAIRPSVDNGVSVEEDEQSDTVIYEVKDGDTLGSVSEMFDVSKNTIRWANNLKSDTFKVGQILIVPPMTGVIHEVKKGDTIDNIAKKYKADKAEIYKYNGINEKSELVVGNTLMVPDGEVIIVKKVIDNKKTNKQKGYKKDGSSRLIESYSNDLGSYFIRPIVGGKKTQGLHGHNGIDLGGMPVGTSVLAAAPGIVSVARSSGYNGGYGEMIILRHDNGTMTVYGHLSAVYVYEGQVVGQGDTIGELGNTGKSTGPHLHFEVRGAVNPF